MKNSLEDYGMFRLARHGEGHETSMALYLEDWDGEIKVAEAPAATVEAWSLTSYMKGVSAQALIDCETTTEDLGGGCFRIQHTLRAKRGLRLSRYAVSFHVAGGAEEGRFRFVPHLHPKPGMVAPDQVFRSPCIILEGEAATLALVPDLESLAALNKAGLRTAMALEGETFSYGIMGHRVKGHVYFNTRSLPGFALERGREIVFAYYLFASTGGGAALHRRVNSFLWDRFGRPRSQEPGPQTLPLAELTDLAGTWAFHNEENWVEMEVGGRRCGGGYAYNMNSKHPPLRKDRLTNTAFIRLPGLYAWILRFGAAHVTNRPLLYRLLRKTLGSNPGASPSAIEFQGWFCNLRSAYGAAWLARERGDDELARRAALVRDLALASPRLHGLFPAVLYLVGDQLVWREGTRGFTVFDRYHLADSCTTGFHLLEWLRDLEGGTTNEDMSEEGSEALEACRAQARAVISLQRPSGAFPAWVAYRRGGPVIDPCLAESAESAPAVMFLSLLASLTGDEECLASARDGGDFLIREVVDSNTWYDYEAFFSCSPKPVGWVDPRSGCRPENTMCMYWTAAALLHLYRACGEDCYLEAGRKALDRLLAYHQVWSPPFLSIDAFGGFASQNTDAEWNDARQGLVAPLLVDYYHATGERELFERGVAALRACFTTMYLGKEPYVPLRPSVRGAIEENYAHFGYDVPTPGYLMLDWGAGSSLYAAARILPAHGDIYVDIPARHAFGIDGFAVREFKLDDDGMRLEVADLLPSPRDALLRFKLENDRPLGLVINGKEIRKYAADELSRGIRITKSDL
ncbi:MAG: hypothetical protein HPY75_03190 [Actinobacteria bacterium]|nr:hypothetical protein [Actinomycetota bacterium]